MTGFGYFMWGGEGVLKNQPTQETERVLLYYFSIPNKHDTRVSGGDNYFVNFLFNLLKTSGKLILIHLYSNSLIVSRPSRIFSSFFEMFFSI